MGRKSTEGEETLPDHLRCSRTDGRQWRCRRRVMENLKLCEIHYLQGRHRQYKEKVPESLKLQRSTTSTTKGQSSRNDVVLKNVEVRATVAKLMKKRKRKSVEDSEPLGGVGSERKNKKKKKCVKKEGDVQLELIRMVLKREVEKKKRKKNLQGDKNRNNKEEDKELHYSEGELRRELPNGVMEIAPASTPHDYGNVGSHCDVKVGFLDPRAVTPRYFRSKNVERVPGGKLPVVPYATSMKKGKRKKCHWCQKSDSWNLIKCSSCQKEFFCMDCIKERYFDTQNEVKMACPVCRRTCTCKDCLASQCKDSESKEYVAGKSKIDRILHFHYLICMVLPVLRQISEDRHSEIEAEAKIKGKRVSDILIKQVESGCNEKTYCNYCKTSILDLHRSCHSCSYSLCLSCYQELSRGSASGHMNSSRSKLPDINVCIADESLLVDDEAISNCNPTALSTLPVRTRCNGAEQICGCGVSHLDLRCVFSLGWIQELEVKAEEIVCSYDFPETMDDSSSCSLCIGEDHKTNRYKLQEAAQREDSYDNCLFYPTALDITSDHLEHFQKHWGKGHPVIVQDVLQSKSNLNWDPLVLFCAYLERSITRYENNKNLLEACLDWCEVEINIRQYFTGSLKCQPQKHSCHEMLRLKGWLSSQLFKEQFPAHFAAVIDALPIQEYMNPMSGLLNVAANLPLGGSTKHDIGPYVYISYGCADNGADSVTKLCYDSYDMVNIMAHTTDVPLSTEQLTKIRKLLKKHKALCQRKSPQITTENSEDMEQKGLQSQSMVGEVMDFFWRRVDRTSHMSTETKTASCRSLDTSGHSDCGSNSDAEKVQCSSLPLHGIDQSTEMSPDHNIQNPSENSISDRSKKFTENSGAQWDVFRRQDVPKLIEYLKRHRDEFSYVNEQDEEMVHPILDQNFFLDNTHKMRLKDEFKIEPWSFEQHVGEAVIIPAGCPYQIRNPKCCVNVVLEFVSPESVTKCVQLIDEVHLLPKDHKARVDKLEVKKMALYSLSTAIKEIRELTCKT